MDELSLQDISYVHSETYSTTQEGRTVAMYIASKWRKEGKNVRVEETTRGISVTYTELGSYGVNPVTK